MVFLTGALSASAALATSLVLKAPEPRATALRPYIETLQAEATAMAQRLGTGPEGDAARPIELRLANDYAAQGRSVGELGPAVIQGDHLDLVLHEADLDDDRDAVRLELARLMIRRAGLELPPALEDGAALWLSGRWYGRTWQDWLGHLAAGGVLPDAAHLLAPERPRDGSRVLFTPVAAAVIEALPGDTLLAKLEPMPSPEVGSALVRDVLLRLESAKPRRPVAQQALRSPDRFHSRFQNGVSFAMVNGVDSGYHAPAAEAQLDLLRNLGVDAVSVMPFAYQRDPKQPGLGFLNRRPSSETDIGVIHAARRAQERGMVVLWKPHLWIGHHSWPGDIEMTTESDWQAWFRDYRRYVMHHAVLAEHAHAEWFAVGVELGKTVHRERDWRELIQAVRRVYSGRLTYAGNWWGDYEQVPFWDALDAICVDAYFPLAQERQADLATLKAGAHEAVRNLRAAAERWNRPVLLTEVGFAAREGAWASPHEEGGTLSEADQRLAWQVLLSELGKPSWLWGIYAWKVFTHPTGEGLGKPDFRILGRPAEQVLRAYYASQPDAPRVDVTSQ
jgi:hypothetical protein